MKWLIVVCSFLIATYSCSNTDLPADVIPPQQMKSIVYDLVRVDEYIMNYKFKDSTTDLQKETLVAYEQVFQLHKVDRKKFYSSYRYYQEHPDQHRLLFDSIQTFGTRKREELNTLQKVQHPKKLDQN